MSKVANVVYSYSPKNVDELELKVGDKIEVIGFEEEGWWKGKLRGRVGVFPSNFVQVVESASLPSESGALSQQLSSPAVTNPENKPNIFGKTSKISSSSNSLNSNNGSSNNNINSTNFNNNTSNGNSNTNNIMMNNTQNQENPGVACADDPAAVTSSERRSKPIRGIGYGDIFAAGAPTPNNTNPTGDRLSSSQLANNLPKQIPKKPPPPTPNQDNGNSNPADRAPALPPKPANQFSPHLQHTRPLPQHPPPNPPQLQAQHMEHQVREQAKVIYAYEPSHEDELALQVGDVIDIIDKDIEDAGWWKGKLRGRIGVFPDNFVQLIETVPSVAPPASQDWHSNRAQSLGAQMQLQGPGAVDPHSHTATGYTPSAEGKLKSVFATTPKGFSKELESNLEKLNSPASFLSLKRNKLQQMHSGAASEPAPSSDESGKRETEVSSLTETSHKKLNHITANRAKGPSRRPPSNILNKRLHADHVKRESNAEDASTEASSLPINPMPKPSNQDSPTPAVASTQQASSISSLAVAKSSEANPSTPIKWNSSFENVLENQSTAPKTSQRTMQQPVPVPQKVPTVSTAPPWMAEFRKANERRRDGPTGAVTSGTADDELASSPKVPEMGSSSPSNPVPSSTDQVNDRKSSVQTLRGAYNNQITTPTLNSVKNLSSRYSGEFNVGQQPAEVQRSGLSNNITSDNTVPSTESSPSSRASGVTKNSHAIKSHESASPSSLNACINPRNVNGNENGNSNPTVPSIVGKASGPPTASKILSSQPALDSSNINSIAKSPSPQRPATVVKDQRDNSPEKPMVIDHHSTTHDKTPILSVQQYDNLVQQISKNVISEISELKDEVSKLKSEFQGLSELKSVLEVMKLELKECQSATENQKRYIKELVNNLADERKKIAAMQTEIDRTLK